MSDRPTSREAQATFGQRVYEYRDDDGVVYYSFTRSGNVITPPKRLHLQSRVGTNFINFMSKLRQLSQALRRRGDG